MFGAFVSLGGTTFGIMHFQILVTFYNSISSIKSVSKKLKGFVQSGFETGSTE